MIFIQLADPWIIKHLIQHPAVLNHPSSAHRPMVSATRFLIYLQIDEQGKDSSPVGESGAWPNFA
jgi:hypothetical protein